MSIIRSLKRPLATRSLAYSLAAIRVVDRRAPIITITPFITVDQTPMLLGSVDDPTATIVVVVLGVDYPAINNGDGTWQLPDNTLAPLPYYSTTTMSVVATDTAGNSFEASGTITCEPDPYIGWSFNKADSSGHLLTMGIF